MQCNAFLLIYVRQSLASGITYMPVRTSRTVDPAIDASEFFERDC
jgi:hypothetical protein